MQGQILASGGSSLSSAISQVTTLASNAISIITGNEVLMVLFVAGLVGVGFAVVRAARHIQYPVPVTFLLFYAFKNHRKKMQL